MTAKDRWGHVFLYEDGTHSGKPSKKGKKIVVSFCYVENDGWTFMNSGANRKISLGVHSSVDQSELMEMIEESEIGEGEKAEFRKLYEAGNLKTGEYRDE